MEPMRVELTTSCMPCSKVLRKRTLRHFYCRFSHPIKNACHILQRRAAGIQVAHRPRASPNSTGVPLALVKRPC